jgi:hypothetical protein
MSILDGGSMLDVIPLDMAEMLVAEGVVSSIEQEPSPFTVIFGKEGATSTINKFIRGAGLIDKVYVTADVRVALISDITFTDKGITILKTADDIWGISRRGLVVFSGKRDRLRSHKSLWQTDLVALLQAQLSPIQSSQQDSSLSVECGPASNSDAIALAMRASSTGFITGPIALMYAALEKFAVSAGFYGGGSNGGGDIGGGDIDGGDSGSGSYDGGGSGGSVSGGSADTTAACFSARPTFCASDVREGKRAQRCFGALNALADTIEAGAIRDVPSTISPALLRRIADLKDNIPYELSQRRRFIQGGSGIHTIVSGEECSLDELGKYRPSTFGAHSAILISDRATGVATPYGTHSKCAVIDVLIVYCRFIHSLGLRVRRAR